MHDFDNFLNSIVSPYRFNIVGWEFRTLLGGSRHSILEGGVEDESSQVIEYFSLVERINTLKSEIEAINTGGKPGDPASLEAELEVLEGQRAVMEETVRRVITKQIKEALAEQRIFNPVDRYLMLKALFPPINFKLESPPTLLVVSPRERIDSIREITLIQGLNLNEMEDIEAEVDELGVSSLVVKLGGFGGTYPTFVSNDHGLRFSIDTATEEWLHQYLAFAPLGFLYILDLAGIARNYDIATMNETVASMVSKEIGAIICGNYYPQCESNSQPQEVESEFDFNQEMREIRRAVDGYLAQGEIEQAEQFMEQKRQFLASKGYYIRKLNQAYFAFHGTYADRPTSISPIGLELKELRRESDSLKEFLNTVAAMTNRDKLREALRQVQ